jgi:hypothetical protein
VTACRQQQISADDSGSSRRQEHITEPACGDRDSQSQTQDVWARSAQTYRSREAHHNIIDARLIKPENTSCGGCALSIDHPLPDLTTRMQRFPAPRPPE